MWPLSSSWGGSSLPAVSARRKLRLPAGVSLDLPEEPDTKKRKLGGSPLSESVALTYTHTHTFEGLVSFSGSSSAALHGQKLNSTALQAC